MAKSALRPIIGSLLQERDQRKIVPFLLTYRIQFTPEELWEQLSSFSNVAPAAFLQFTLLWLDCSYDNIALSKTLLRNVITAFEKLKMDDDLHKVKLACIRSWYGRKMRIAPQVPHLTIDQPLTSPEQANTNIGTFLNSIQKLSVFSVTGFVEQMCVLEHSLLCQITPREIISKFRSGSASTPHLSALARFFNIVVYWVASKVVTSFSTVANPEEGAHRVSRAITETIQMLDSAMQLRNFSLVAALAAGLNQLCVERLPPRIWDSVDPLLRNMLGTFSNFASPLKNYQEYRTRVAEFETKRAELAVIDTERGTDAMLPLMPVVLRDMTIIHEGNPDMLPSAHVGGELKVNWEKLGLLGSQLARLDEVKKRKYPFRADSRFAQLFLRCAPLTEAELHHQLSYVQKCLSATPASSSTPAAQFVGALMPSQQSSEKANVITGREAKAGTKFAKMLMEDRTLVRMMLDKVQLNSTGRYGQAIARVFHSYNADQGLIKMIVTRAVEQGEDVTKVFHESTVFSDLASEYMRLNGTDWLRRVMRLPLKKLLEHTTPEVFECYTLTPSGGGTRSVTFSKELMQLCDEVIAAFHDEIKHIPSALRTAINPLSDAVDQKFGAAKRNVAIGGLVLFRFVCPAVADPVRFRLTKGPISNNATKRALVHLSKVLKACVTNPDLNNPEATEYVRTACLRLEKLYNELRKAPSKRDPPEIDVGQAVLPSVALLRSLNRQWKLVEAELLARNAKSSLSALEEVSQEAFDNIQLLRSQSAVEQNTLDQSANSLTGDEIPSSAVDSTSFDDESSNNLESSSSNSSLRTAPSSSSITSASSSSVSAQLSSVSLNVQVIVPPAAVSNVTPTKHHHSKKEKHKDKEEKSRTPPSPHPVVFQCSCPDGQTRLVRAPSCPGSFSELQQLLAKELRLNTPTIRYQDPASPSTPVEVRSDKSLRVFLANAPAAGTDPVRVYQISVN